MATIRLTGDWAKLDVKMKQLSAEGYRQFVSRVLNKMALFYKQTIQKNIKSRGGLAGEPFVPNKPSTIKRKKSSLPLVDTGELFNSISYIVEVSKKRAIVGVERGPIYKDGQKVSDIAKVNEFGAVTKNGTVIPSRPFIRSVLNSVGIYGKAVKLFEREVKRLLKK